MNRIEMFLNDDSKISVGHSGCVFLKKVYLTLGNVTVFISKEVQIEKIIKKLEKAKKELFGGK